MIIGLGTDLTDITRIEKTLERYADRFTKRLFTEGERQSATGKADQAAFYAKRFAAKEACAKALGTGFTKSVFFHNIEVVSLPSGQPTLCLTGGALAQLEQMTPDGMRAVIHLSLSDDRPLAQATVLIEALP